MSLPVVLGVDLGFCSRARALLPERGAMPRGGIWDLRVSDAPRGGFSPQLLVGKT